MKGYRFYVRSPDGRAIYGFDRMEAAQAVALEYGPGAAITDTLAQAYQPMLHLVEAGNAGPAVVLGPFGGWDTGRFSLERDLIEAIKKGHVALVHAFLAKGASVNARDERGGTALHWAVGRGRLDVVEFLLKEGADACACDSAGRTALGVAESRGHTEIAALLRQKGTV